MLSPHTARHGQPRLLILGLAIALAWAAGPGSGSADAAAPTCADQSYTVASGSSVQIPIGDVCSDADADALSGVADSFPSHGSLGPDGAGGGVYSAASGYSGPDSFTLHAVAGGESSNVVTISITVTGGANQPPMCFDSSLREYNGSGEGVSFQPACYDFDTPPNELSATLVDAPVHGQLSGPLQVSSPVTYTSEPGFQGVDTFTYRVSDGTGESALATVTIDVAPFPVGNRPPTCPASHAYVPEGDSIVLRANCVDPDGDPISYALAPPNVQHGTLSDPTGTSIRYTPNDTSPDVLGYSAQDPFHAPVPFQVEITVVPAGDPCCETAPEATPSEPYAASVRSPVPGPIYIDGRRTTTTAPSGYTLLGQEFDITAPDAISAGDPLRFVFKLDASEVAAAGVPAGQIKVFRNGAAVPDCSAFGAGRAEPTPCIDDRKLFNGDLELTALTMQASVWNFGISSTPPPPRLPATKDDCKRDGWKSYGMFKNQGDCVSFVATHGKH